MDIGGFEMSLNFASESNYLIVKELEVGDRFAIVDYDSWYNNYSSSIMDYTVNKVMKRDVVCKDSKDEELRLNKNNFLSGCYRLDDPKLVEIKENILKTRRAKKIKKELSNIDISEIMGNDSFMNAAEVFIKNLGNKL